MSQLTTGTAYIFSWFAEDDGMIHAFGMTPENETVHLIILNFTRYCYIELPPEIDWDNPIHQRSFQEAVGSMNQEIYPQQMVFMKKHRLYRAHMVKTEQGYQRCLFPYLFVCFKTQKAMIDFTRRVSWGIYIESIGRKINFRSHEQDASPFLQLAVCRNIPVTGWIDFTGVKQSDDWNSSYCKHEYVLNWNTLSVSKDQKLLKTLPKVKIVSFDWEANSTNHNRMPNEKKPGDVLFQCSMSVFEHGSDKIENHLLTLGYPDPAKVSEGRADPVKIHHYATEADILEGFAKMIIELDPQVITGYNIMGWDFNYMIARAKLNNVYQSFSQFGYIKGMSAKEKNITWSSSAFSKQSFSYPAIAGRIIIDMLPVIKRGFRFASYTLSNVSVEILGPNQTKDPLTPQGIFKCFQIGSPETLGIVGKYCFAPGTRVSLSGQSITIEQLENIKEDVLTWDEKRNGFSYSNIKNFFSNGERECIKLVFNDSTEIICTPDHKFLTTDGWVEAKDIISTSKIIFGPEPAKCDYLSECKNTFKVNDIVGDLSYEKSCIFMKLLGYLLSDGTIITDSCSRIDIGTMIDAIQIQNDIKKLVGECNPIRKAQYAYNITLPSKLTKMFTSIDGIVCGRKITQECLVPNFLFSESTPLWIIREFLKGFMGGDGWSPCLNKADSKFTAVGISKSKTIEHIEYLKNAMLKLKDIFIKFGILSILHDPQKNASGDGYSVKLSFTRDSTINFYENIGYAYCACKSYKLACLVSYIRMKNKTRTQFEYVCSRTRQLMDLGYVSNKAHEIACNELKQKEPIFSPASLPPCDTARKCRKNIKGDDFKTKKGTFPKFDEYLLQIGAYKYFVSDSSKKSHVVKQDDEVSPGFYLSVISRISVGLKRTYDIEVSETHTFVANGAVVHNCVRDSEVTSFLFQKLKTWVDSCQMSSIMGVPIFDLSTQGQQVKIYAQIYRDCFLKNTVVEKNGYVCEKDESYTGAIVLTPIPGLHENVVTFDFASLYPSVIVEKNICYSTWVIDLSIPDEDCHVLEWEDHINCPHDTEKRTDKKKVMCAKRKYRFLKTPQGILPNILTRLTAERKKVKKELEGVEEKEKEEKDPILKKDLKMYATILDMTQIAIKTVSNSMYGVMGVTEGRLPFMPGAMSTTAGGRAAIMKAKKIILDRHPGKVIYGDTDSLMYIFDDMKRFEDEKGKIDYKALEKFCNKVSEEISCNFEKPMKLEFENIAEQFFILTKKRYISKLSNGKIKKRGIMLTRRDNAACSRKAYEGLLNLIFQKAPLDKILDYIVEALNQIYSHYYPSKDYAITKSIKDIDTYKVKALSTELVARQRQLKNKFLPYVEPNNPQASKIEDEYKFRSLPAHVQLAETMRSRGSIVESGSRFAYVVTTKGGPSGKMWQKIESLEYYSRHQGMINLDSNYYGKALINPFDEVLQIMFQQQHFTKHQHKIRLQKYEMLQELKRLMAPQLIAE